MSKLTKLTSAAAAAGVGLAMLATPIVAQAKEVHIKVQAVIGTQTTEVRMLRDFMDDVTALTGGEALSMVMNDPARNGLECWRRLNRRFDPQTAGRRKHAMSTILNVKSVSLKELPASIAQIR